MVCEKFKVKHYSTGEEVWHGDTVQESWGEHLKSVVLAIGPCRQEDGWPASLSDDWIYIRDERGGAGSITISKVKFLHRSKEAKEDSHNFCPLCRSEKIEFVNLANKCLNCWHTW